MQEDELQELLARYLSGTVTDAERQRLLDWYQDQSGPTPPWVAVHPGERDEIKARISANLRAHQARDTARKRWHANFWLSRVAAFLILASGLIAGLYFWKADQKVNAPVQGIENRYVLLPDGSKVILRAGSELIYPRAFNGNTREVTLKGEAYFDVARDKDKPFIIHSGGLKTVVLGTAFNIQAFPDRQQVSVSVSRGKVRVEKGAEVLAVLNPDEQMIYRKRAQMSEKHNVQAREISAWTEKDMRFDALAFKTIAERLERRYQVKIRFKNKAMESCPITGRFSGTESLTQVLDVLCGTRNARYTIDEGVVYISGQGCL